MSGKNDVISMQNYSRTLCVCVRVCVCVCAVGGGGRGEEEEESCNRRWVEGNAHLHGQFNLAAPWRQTN